MYSPVVAFGFVAGFSLAGLVAWGYIRLLRRKIKSYEMYVKLRIDGQIAKLLPSQAITAAPMARTADVHERVMALFSGVAPCSETQRGARQRQVALAEAGPR